MVGAPISHSSHLPYSTFLGILTGPIPPYLPSTNLNSIFLLHSWATSQSTDQARILIYTVLLTPVPFYFLSPSLPPSVTQVLSAKPTMSFLKDGEVGKHSKLDAVSNSTDINSSYV
jgi:hypothetical protein